MLILARKKQERVVIAGRITITVLETKGNRVRLGIAAPAEVKIARSELLGGRTMDSRPRVGH